MGGGLDEPMRGGLGERTRFGFVIGRPENLAMRFSSFVRNPAIDEVIGPMVRVQYSRGKLPIELVAK